MVVVVVVGLLGLGVLLRVGGGRLVVEVDSKGFLKGALRAARKRGCFEPTGDGSS